MPWILVPTQTMGSKGIPNKECRHRHWQILKEPARRRRMSIHRPSAAPSARRARRRGRTLAIAIEGRVHHADGPGHVEPAAEELVQPNDFGARRLNERPIADP